MSEITLLDGGMGQELLRRTGDKPTHLWATQVMLDHPGLVTEIHRDYFAAGATVATTNTYAIHHDRFAGTALDGKLFGCLATAMNEAEKARSAFDGARIAGSIGPLVGSYRPETHPPYQVAVPLYAELAGFLAKKADFLLIETAASVAHARAALEGATSAGKPVWLAVTVDDENGAVLRSGEPLEALSGLEPDVWLANCSAPEAMTQAMPGLRGLGKPFGAYANAFTQITKEFLKDKPTADALSARRDMTPDLYAEFVMSWVEEGATIVGGCCETGPKHIKAIANRLRAAGHTIV
jgi:homocysteine S-methyltransferase